MRKANSSQARNEQALADICPFAHTLSVLGRRWRPAILWKMAQGPDRYGALRRALPNISEKMLAAELVRLTKLGLIRRKCGSVAGAAAPTSSYHLTKSGRAILPLLRAMTVWAERDLAA